MNTMSSGIAQPHLRASDADRDVVVAELSRSFEAGRLTSEEFDERTSSALAARTIGDLAELTADLPPAPPPPWAGPATPAGPPGPGHGHPRLAPQVLAILAAAAIIAIVLGSVTNHGSWHLWWLVVVPLVIARQAGRGRPGRRIR